MKIQKNNKKSQQKKNKKHPRPKKKTKPKQKLKKISTKIEKAKQSKK